MIGYIHPFNDGNGRTGRALFYWFLLKSGYDNFQYVSISSLLKSSKNKYARAFVKTETDGFDATHFIDFNMNIIIRALEDFTKYIQNKIDEIQKTRLDIHKSPYFNEFKLPHITIIKKALEDSGREFTVKECQVEFNVSSTAARAYLDKLSDLGLLIKHPIKGRKMGYIAPRNLRERLKID
jgi:Fic family protein